MSKSILNKIREHKITITFVNPVFHFIAIKLPVFFAWFIGFLYAFIVIANPDKDTTVVSNFAAGICVVLSGLCFSMSRSVYFISSIKALIIFSGERFFHAALMFILVSIFKYASFTINNLEMLAESQSFVSLLTTLLHYFLLFLLVFGLWDAENRFDKINKVLWHQFYAKRDMYTF